MVSAMDWVVCLDIFKIQNEIILYLPWAVAKWPNIGYFIFLFKFQTYFTIIQYK